MCNKQSRTDAIDATLNIVVVEDNEALRDLAVNALQDMGHTVIGLECAEEIDERVGRFAFDLVLIDLNLPGEDGFSLAQRLRASQPHVGIIIVTALNDLNNKLQGYESGTDLYLVKPVSRAELQAAVQAITRRLRPTNMRSTYILNTSTLDLQGPNGRVALSPTAAAMLSAFARASRGRLETWQLLELCSQPDINISKSTLEVQIVRLRKKLMSVGEAEQPIQAIRGWGYQLCLPLQLVDFHPEVPY